MLDTIRRAQPAIIKGVLGVVVLAFVATIFLDWGWQLPRPDAPMATVGGEGVSLHEFQMTYTNLTDFYRRALPGPLHERISPVASTSNSRP